MQKLESPSLTFKSPGTPGAGCCIGHWAVDLKEIYIEGKITSFFLFVFLPFYLFARIYVLTPFVFCFGLCLVYFSYLSLYFVLFFLFPVVYKIRGRWALVLISGSL